MRPDDADAAPEDPRARAARAGADRLPGDAGPSADRRPVAVHRGGVRGTRHRRSPSSSPGALRATRRRPGRGASSRPPTPAPRPTDDSAEGLAGPVCLGPGAWRIASVETWRDPTSASGGRSSRSPTASGPLDPAIPTVPLFGLEVQALGWCAPAYGPERPVGPAQVDAWIVIDGVADELELRQVLPARGTTALAGLYVPVAPCALGAACAPSADAARPAALGDGAGGLPVRGPGRRGDAVGSAPTSSSMPGRVGRHRDLAAVALSSAAVSGVAAP